MKIGIFDSGIGGITVLHQALLALPQARFLYYADADHVPYGEKTREEIVRYADEAVGFLARRGAVAVVVACNTATSAAIGFLRGKYRFPILGMEPAVKPAVQTCGDKRVMVVATPVTVRQDKLRNLLKRVDRTHTVDLLALPGLVPLAERGEFDSPRVRQYLERTFAPYDLSRYSVLVLGCTHFNYFKDTFARIFPSGVAQVDGCEGTVNNLVRVLRQTGLSGPGEPGAEYYISGRAVTDAPTLEKIARLHRRLGEMLRY
ncbi:MAG TPA: glutamate racemase [Ruminococcaceae bacterium]|jgi:glutamate racemase|nr:glutamate racemase [Oscillospiraceae bacterium]HBG55808.1 glutamate racemase [Oscillospiraceae bacterium]HBQ45616.1 glutamate racemase [Oscillospiraceae bacterium]HCB91660.1 glutamate racemase [Oscillospiraceae bacterium]